MSSAPTKNHAEREHAPYAPSSANRWINCAAVVPLTDDLEVAGQLPSSESEHTIRGTAGHQLAEKVIVGWLQLDSDEVMGGKEQVTDSKMKVHEFDNAPLVPYVSDYVKAVRDTFQEEQDLCGVEEVVMSVEVRVDVHPPNCWGSVDCLIVTPQVLHIFDLKCGDGKLVEAENNEQLMTYAVGVCEAYAWQFEEINLHIVQRAWADAGSEPHRISFIERDELQAFQVKLELAIKESRKKKSRENATLGDHCKWCPAAGICPAQKERALSVLDADDINDLADVETLSEEQLLFVLENGDLIVDWIKDAKKHAYSIMQNGHKIDGFKLVEGKSNRRWDNEIFSEDEIAAELVELGIEEPYQKKFMTITAAEKELGKGKIDDLLITPPGPVVLVPDSDKRPAIGNNKTDVLDELDDLE